MHEMTIALNIIDIATKESAKANASRINNIEIEIGSMSGVDVSALKFALDIAVKNTMLENSNITMIPVNAKVECMQCKSVFHLEDFYQTCPGCDSLTFNVIQGKELKIKSINID
jgi:hydrogenase nickel incorporation protein HypA/HybF